jgi:hypothetical protein
LLQNRSLTRLQLFEFHEQPWYPQVLRSALTEWLRALWEYSEGAKVIAPMIERIVRETGSNQIIDLCSGGGGPMIPVGQHLERRGIDIPILATDKFPDPAVMAELSRKTHGRIEGSLESLDATRLPENLTGLRTLFNSFHHFSPDVARRILQDAYRNRQPIAIFEITERAAGKVVLSFPATFVAVFLLLARMRPWRLSWWILTWVVPVLPLTIGWDGLVSHLRSYTETELGSLVEAMDQSYSWETGRVPAPRGGVRISYLIGRPA